MAGPTFPSTDIIGRKFAADPSIIPLHGGGKAPRRRLRIAVLLDHLNSFSGGYEAQLRDAIHAHAARPAIICCWSTAGRWRPRSHWMPPTTPSTSCFAPTPSTASSSCRRCCRPTVGRAASRGWSSDSRTPGCAASASSCPAFRAWCSTIGPAWRRWSSTSSAITAVARSRFSREPRRTRKPRFVSRPTRTCWHAMALLSIQP